MKSRIKTAVVVLVVAVALAAVFLTVRWFAYGPGNITVNDFKPGPIPSPPAQP